MNAIGLPPIKTHVRVSEKELSWGCLEINLWSDKRICTFIHPGYQTENTVKRKDNKNTNWLRFTTCAKTVWMHWSLNLQNTCLINHWKQFVHYILPHCCCKMAKTLGKVSPNITNLLMVVYFSFQYGATYTHKKYCLQNTMTHLHTTWMPERSDLVFSWNLQWKIILCQLIWD